MLISVNCLGLKMAFVEKKKKKRKSNANCSLSADILPFSFQTVLKYPISELTYLHHISILLHYAITEDVLSIIPHTRFCMCP